MPRGGKREGAGRKKGSKTTRTQEVALRAIEEGITPLEVMLGAMREAWERSDKDGAARFARDAAPYVHPRLAAVEHTGKDGQPIELVSSNPTGDIDQARRVAFALGRALERQRMKVIDADAAG